MFLYEIVDAFQNNQLKYVLVGGYALALHGLVRATMDVDLVISLTQDDFERAERVLGRLGLQSRLPIRAQDVIKMRKEYIEKRNLIAWSFVDFQNPARQVDLLITKDARKMDAQVIPIGGRKVTVASLKELRKMKEEAGRPQDMVDIENIKAKIRSKK